jgi:pimeloyl-ACP methyl ester carboxylesterase
MITTFQADLADAQYVDRPGWRFAYQRLGPRSGVPLTMAIRFRGTIDHWDPALLDVLSSERDVIVFDNRGTGRSSGTAFTRRLLLWPTPLRRLVVRATVPVWIAWIFIEQSPLWVAFHRLLDDRTATQQSRERPTTGWRGA